MTVSRVINGNDRVSPAARRSVEQAISELGYVPSRLARGLSRQRTGTLALVVPDVANPFFTLIVRAAEDVARRAGYRIVLCDTRGDLTIEREVIEEMIAHRVEGIVIAPVSDRSRSHLLRFAKFGVPFVLVDRTVPGIDVDTILGDSVGGAEQLVEHLIGLGHRRIGFIVESDEVSTARDRRRGYESALQAAGIPLNSELVAKATVDPQGGFNGMQRLLELDDPPTAVFTVSNLVALGAIEAVREVGLEVPDDVALVCFDDIEYASRLNPFLTVMEQPAEAFGTMATQLLIDRIEGRGSERPRMVVLPAAFVIREILRRLDWRAPRMTVYGGIEAGGSKWVCAVGTGPTDLRAVEAIPTTSPSETIERVVRFFEREGPVAAVGIGSFGPVDRIPTSPTWGHITTTPKPGWADTDVGQEIRRRLSVPIAFDTDVNAAALGEYRWGAAQGLDTFCYVTIGTGIGGGGMVGGKLLHGLVHPEFGHIRIPHDTQADPFLGACPYHRDCWEGLASGRAIQERWGLPARELSDASAWNLASPIPRTRPRLGYLPPLPGAHHSRWRRDEPSRPVGSRATERRRARERVPRSRDVGPRHLDVHHAAVPRLPHRRSGRHRSSPIG